MYLFPHDLQERFGFNLCVQNALFLQLFKGKKNKTVSLNENMFQALQSPSEVSRKILARVRVVIVTVSSTYYAKAYSR